MPQLFTLRFLLAKALFTNRRTFHFDFKRAFTNTPLERTLYVKMPKGFKKLNEAGEEMCLALSKSAEGPKQSGTNWLAMLHKFLIGYGFVQSVTEPKLYVLKLPNNDSCDIMVYVDDVLGVCGSDDFISQLLYDFNNIFGVECLHLGEISHAIGIDVVIGDGFISLNQKAKIEELLIRENLTQCSGRKTPLPSNFNIVDAMQSGNLLSKQDKTRYQSFVGSFLWINRGTRPNISFATWILAGGMTAPTEELLAAAIHLTMHLKYTIEETLTYSFEKYSELDLSSYDYDSQIPTGFSDANWAAPKSVSSTLIMFQNAALLWRVSKQASTALSTVESELVALSDVAQDLEYTRKIFIDLSLLFPALPTFCDSKGAIENAKHPTLKNKLKHVDIKSFYIRGCLERFFVSLFKISGLVNPADIGTKILGYVKYNLFSGFIMNQ